MPLTYPGGVPEALSRDYGCTESEWRRWVPEGSPGCAVAWTGPHGASVTLPEGRLHLAWRVLEPRRIALIVLPRLAVDFRFEGAPPAVREAWLRTFDLTTQRGGG